jgi:hypothetical protein
MLGTSQFAYDGMCFMHDFLAAFFGLFLSLFQAQAVHHSQTFIPPEQAAAAAMLEPGSQTEFAPTRQQVAQSRFGRSYADGEWTASAHRMNATYFVR